MSLRYLPDLPISSTEEDLLGFRGAAQEALTQICGSEPPFTWGIYGDWGSGKTSLMRLIYGEMEGELAAASGAPGLPLHVPVWFDAWRYENEVDILYPLFHAIRRDFEERCQDEVARSSLAASFKQVAVASLLGLSDLAVRAATKAAFGEAYKLDDAKKAVELAQEPQTIFDEWVNRVDRARADFEAFVGTYLAEYRRLHLEVGERALRLAVFVDDLDRCLPDVAINLLERIKNHLDSADCIFVLGINRKVVYQSIRQKYQGLDIDGRQHLEKIIQHSRGVPEPRPEELSRFVVESLTLLVTDAARIDTALFPEFSRALNECGFVNPRRIKRILNRFLTFLHRSGSDGLGGFTIPAVARLIVMREYYQPLYDLFTEEGFDALDAIVANDGTERAEKEFLKRFGSKWRPLTSSFSALRGLAELEPGGKKTAPDYVRAVNEVFGRED